MLLLWWVFRYSSSLSGHEEISLRLVHIAEKLEHEDEHEHEHVITKKPT